MLIVCTRVNFLPMGSCFADLAASALVGRRHFDISVQLGERTKIYIEFVNHLFGHGSALAQLAATALQAAWRGYASRGRRMAGRLGA